MRHFIREHLEHINVKMFTESRADLKEVLFKKPGIYALYKKDRLVYVGKATNLFQRLQNHRRDRHAKTWDTFSAYVTKSNDVVHEVESLALRLAWPPANRKSGRFGKSTNLRPSLRAAFRERQRTEEIELLGKRRKASQRGEKASRKKKAASTADNPLANKFRSRRVLRGSYKGKIYHAKLSRNGTLKVGNLTGLTPTGARKTAIRNFKSAYSGWKFWHYKDKAGEWRPIDELR
ncbi:MAG: GIY-YIG nuclease family protein [Phycisphaerales bacterium]|nr:GIY-YIG nuclease family protein [Phycisphaerales bacterium]